MKKILLAMFLLLGTNLGCTVVDDALLELILEIKNQNQELLEEVKSLQSKLDSLVNELKKSAAKQEEVLKKVTDLQAELAKVVSQIGKLSEQLTSQDADLEAIKSQLADLQKKYEGILKQLEQLQKLSQILAEIEKLKAQLSNLNITYELIVGGLAQNSEKLEVLKSQISAIQIQLNSNLNLISQLTTQLGNQNSDIKSILDEIKKLKDSFQELNNLINELLGNASPKIGDEFGGGIVFYVKDTGVGGLIVSKSNLRDSSTEWGCYCQDIKNTKPNLGSGQSNTKEMLTQCLASQSISNWSAKIVDQYVFEGFDDWYLPSKDELDLIYKNLHIKGLGNFSTTISYWTSTQASYGSCGISGGGWTQNFGNGQQIQEYKPGFSGTGAVRAVRSF